MATISALAGALWTVLHSALYGFHISALNGVQDAVVCRDRPDIGSRYGLKECLDVTDQQFGVIVTIFTLGGLLGSFTADRPTKWFGRIGVLRIAEVGLIVGAVMVGIANDMVVMIIGRLIIGYSAGFVLVTVPLYLEHLAPPRYKKLFGTLHQISIGIGMIFAQSLSIPFAKPFQWRWVLAVGAGLGVLVLLMGVGLGWSDTVKNASEVDREAEGGDDEETPLVRRDDPKEDITVKDLFVHTEKSIRRGVLVVAIAQISQQICGISPVMYFSTHILSSVFSASSKYVALGIMAIGIPFNFIPGLLPESFGTKRLLITSAAGTAMFSFLLGMGLNMKTQILSAIGVLGFVLSFSIGLAPMPWIALPEIMPLETRTAAGAIGVSCNWLTNFLAGSSFLPLQEILKHGDEREGNVFYVFGGLSILACLGIYTSYHFWEKAKHEEEEEQEST